MIIVCQQRSVAVYKSPNDIPALAEADILFCGDIVPGLELVVREIFV
jgi:hypothetical protein